MRKGLLIRRTDKSGDAGTFSDVYIRGQDGGLVQNAMVCVGGELPPRGNQHGLSCLAPMPGEAPITYLLKFQYSAAHKCNKYTVVGVLNADGSVGPIPGNRVAAEVHAANLMGDILKGLGAQVEGCMAFGLTLDTFPAGAEFHTFTAASPDHLVLLPLAHPQLGVAASGTAVAAFEAELAGEDLALTVSWT